MGKILNADKKAAGFLKQLGGFVKTWGALQGLCAAADALVLASFYFLIVKAVSPLVIKGEEPQLMFLYCALPLVLVRLALGLIIAKLNAKIAYQAEVLLKEDLIQTIINKGVFDKAYDKSLVSLVNDAADQILPFYTSYLKGKRKAVAFAVLMWTAVLTASFMSAFVLLVIAPLIPIFMILIGKITYRLSQRQLETLTRLSERFYQSFLNLPLIRLYGLEKRQGEIIKRASKRWRVETLQILYVAFLSAAALEFFATAGVALCAILLGFAIYENGFPYESALFVLLCVPEFFAPLRNLGTYYHQKQQALAAAAKIAVVFESKGGRKTFGIDASDKETLSKNPTAFEQNNSFSTKRCNLSEQFPTDFERSNRFSHKLHTCGQLNVENLSVAYPDGRLGIEDFSAVIKLNRITALKGPSGAGKSTLLLTLFNQLSPVSGGIYLGGEDYFKLADNSRLGFVPQIPHLFFGTLRDNLTLFNKGITDEVLLKRLERAGALSLLEEFSEGLDKKVGEGSRLISGGQLRLIALMRTLVKECDAVLLDEPTASLDEESEKLFLEIMRRVLKDKTVIIASHRELTLSYCDEEVEIARK